MYSKKQYILCMNSQIHLDLDRELLTSNRHHLIDILPKNINKLYLATGDTVGESVGDTVGLSVGESVGDTVGLNVGESVGDAVGPSVWPKPNMSMLAALPPLVA